MSKQLRRSGSYLVEIITWEKTVKVYKNKQQGQEWYIVSNLELSHQEGVANYAKRFRIEKLFQDLKSSGFNLEKSKIIKYDRFKRLLFICCLAYSLMLLLGNWIDKELTIKKNSPIFTNLLIASSNLPERLLPTTHQMLTSSSES